MRAVWGLLLLVLVAGGLRRCAGQEGCAGVSDFVEMNPLYSFITEPVPELLAPDAAYTVFIPLLNATTAAQAQAFPQLSPNLVLPDVYWNASELVAAGSVQNLANVTITLKDNPEAGTIEATFVELGATASIYPVAFPLGNSVAYAITVLQSGDVAEQVAAGPASGA